MYGGMYNGTYGGTYSGMYVVHCTAVCTVVCTTVRTAVCTAVCTLHIVRQYVRWYVQRYVRRYVQRYVQRDVRCTLYGGMYGGMYNGTYGGMYGGMQPTVDVGETRYTGHQSMPEVEGNWVGGWGGVGTGHWGEDHHFGKNGDWSGCDCGGIHLNSWRYITTSVLHVHMCAHIRVHISMQACTHTTCVNQF